MTSLGARRAPQGEEASLIVILVPRAVWVCVPCPAAL